jgi:hypothetical protein
MVAKKSDDYLRVLGRWLRIMDSPLSSQYKEKLKMLETIAVLLIVFWLLGYVSSYTMGGFIHILLVVAIIVIVIRVIQGRRPL